MSLINDVFHSPLAFAATAPSGSMAPRGYPVIAAWHLRLRPFSLTDIPRLVKFAAVRSTANTALTAPPPHNARSARQWIESHPLEWQRRRAIHWAVSSLEDDLLRGYVGLCDVQIANRQAELRFWTVKRIGRSHLALEVAHTALAFAFTCLHMEDVRACPLGDDPRLVRILRQLGMSRLTKALDAKSRPGSTEETLAWSVSRSNWEASLDEPITN